MPALIAAALAWLARILPALLSFSRVLTFFKGLLSAGLFTIGIPLAINWGIFKVMQNFSAPMFDTLGLSPQSIQLTQLGAWFAVCLKLPACLSVFLGFVAKRAVLNMVKIGGIFSKFTTDRYSH
ncbi:hypothetical protein KOM00_09980 [Geomonas sp. Red69]|uniref:hypothetical protein n=1 Tax=Geomonas diazotrophica TaxID=2843197 RepID=UPI001C11B0B4|nr:hypothetical protein [Geomonas diazotrophica]MBU5637061.1 hypothetical protein [Geomonas diazotrophica]